MTVDGNTLTPPQQSFAGLPLATRLKNLEADIAIIGLDYTSPYPQNDPTAKNAIAEETALDVNDLTAKTATQLLLNFIGILARSRRAQHRPSEKK